MGRYSYKSALDILWNWSLKEGFIDIDLAYSGTSQIDWIKNTLNKPKDIKIEPCKSYEEQVYVWLHELGHHQLRKNWAKFHRELPSMAIAEEEHLYAKDTKYLRRQDYIVSHLEEEYKAWEEGFKLGERLGIKINMAKWAPLKSKCLMSYIRYFASLKK
jgi:hypothetical protein